MKEIHDSYKYSNSGLGAGAQLVIAIALAAVMGPAAAAAMGGGALGAAGAAVAVSASTNATVSFVNNRGDLGAVLKDTTSSDALKGYAISGVTAGLTQGVYNDLTGTTTNPITGKINVNLSSFKGIGQFAASQALQNGTAAGLSKILGQGGDLGDVLQNTLYNTLAAASFNAVGDHTQGVYADGSLQKIMIHAMVGGLLAEASGGDFKTGALAGGANEALVDQLNTWVGGNQDLLNMTSQLVGVLAAAAQKDATIDDLNKGKWVAENATQYNFLNHQDVEDLEQAQKDCKAKGNCDQVKADFLARSDANRERLNNCGATGNCAAIRAEIDGGSKALTDLYTRQEIANPGGTDSDIAYYILRDRNESDWTTAGLLHLDQIANLWQNNDPRWMAEGSAYLSQSGFNPYGINPLALSGLAPGKSTAKEMMAALKAGELPKGDANSGKAASSMAGLPDAEAGMPYNHPTKTVSIPSPRQVGNLAGGPLEQTTQVSGRFKLDGGPVNGAVYRADNQGNITSYAVYDSAGMIVKRVDVTGAAHVNIPTPHVIEYGRNKLPDGTVRVQSPSTKLAPRPAKSDEIP